MSQQYVRLIARRILSAVRDLWLIVGVCIALLVIAESCYRLQQAARTSMASTVRRLRNSPASDTVRNPVRSQPWYPEFSREFVASSKLAWRPFVYFRRASAYTGRYVNVDSARHRVTPPVTSAPVAARVYFFGGSTMWGSYLRDDHTIAADASRRLQAAAPAGTRIDVTNLGETGHVSTQGMLELILQLRAGNRPDVVLFYDGINDVYSELQNGEPGYGLNEQNRVVDFTMGRSLSWAGHTGVSKDVHTLGVLANAELTRLQLVQQLGRAVHKATERPLPPVDSAARAVVRVYAENVRIVEALAKAYGFTAVYVWQPTLHATDKVLTPYEKTLTAQFRADPFETRLAEVHRAVLPMLDSAIAPLAPGRFVNEGHLFAGDTLGVFSDRVGHNTEAAIPFIVCGFWPTLQRVLPTRARVPETTVVVATP